MKKRKNHRLFAVCWLMLAAIVFSACATAPPDYFAYREKSATAELRGELFGKPFCAKLTLSLQEAGCSAKLEYLSLGEIQNLQISAFCNRDGEPIGEASVALGGIAHTCDASAMQGLLSPITALLSLQAPASVTHQEKEYSLGFEDGSRLTLDARGSPKSVHTETVDFWVVWWENAEISGE